MSSVATRSITLRVLPGETEFFRTRSKIQLRADLEETADHNDLRHPERPVGGTFGQDRARIQRVVDIEIHRCAAGLPEPDDFADAEVQLVDPVTVEGARRGSRGSRRQCI